LSKKITVAICCYGLYDWRIRSGLEMEGLEEYLRHCAHYVASLFRQGTLSGVILCGGFTNKTKPEVSEAKTNAKRLIEMLADLSVDAGAIGRLIWEEDKSFNTPQNLYFAGRLVYRGDIELSRNMVFICDRYRHVKVLALLRYVRLMLSKEFRFSVKSFPRKDIHPNSSWVKQFAAAMLYLVRPQRFYDDLKQGQEVG